MLLNNRQKEFIDKIVIEGKNLYTVSKEMDIPINTVFDWYDELDEEIKQLKTEQALNILEKYDISPLSHLEHLGKLYQKLKDEMEKRDFSGLPTDKLYSLLIDVRNNINTALNEVENIENIPWFDDDEYDDDDDNILP